MEKLNLLQIIIGTIIIVSAVFGGITLSWNFAKDWTTLYSDGTIIAREKWIVEAERTFIVKDSWYDINKKCPKIMDMGGHTTATRCYYPDNYYEQLSRSLINTKIEVTEEFPLLVITKRTPDYKYGTRGSYAGFLVEEMFFEEDVTDEEDFPIEYLTEWNPRDTRNYKLVWRVENLKQINLPDGEYTDCFYEFGSIKINLKDECSKLDKAVIKDNSKIYFHFKNQRGKQSFDIDFVDPIEEEVPNAEETLYQVQDCKTTYWNTTQEVWDTREVYHEGNDSTNDEYYLKETLIIPHNRTDCQTVFYKYGNEILNASEWCCYDNFCGLKRDYDCNYVTEKRKQPNHSYKELDTGFVKIDANDLKENYITEKSKLEGTDTSSFTIK